MSDAAQLLENAYNTMNVSMANYDASIMGENGLTPQKIAEHYSLDTSREIEVFRLNMNSRAKFIRPVTERFQTYTAEYNSIEEYLIGDDVPRGRRVHDEDDMARGLNVVKAQLILIPLKTDEPGLPKNVVITNKSFYDVSLYGGFYGRGVYASDPEISDIHRAIIDQRGVSTESLLLSGNADLLVSSTQLEEYLGQQKKPSRMASLGDNEEEQGSSQTSEQEEGKSWWCRWKWCEPS